jgi:hypothetical protein
MNFLEFNQRDGFGCGKNDRNAVKYRLYNGGVLRCSQTTKSLMNRSKTQTAIIAGLVIVLAAGITTAIFTRHHPQGVFKKESWVFAGYASPEDALQTYFWAMNKQDVTNLEASMTPEANTDFMKGLKDSGETADQFFKETAPVLQKISGYRILKLQKKSADEMDCQIAAAGAPNKNDWMTIKKVGAEWKVDESPF